MLTNKIYLRIILFIISLINATMLACACYTEPSTDTLSDTSSVNITDYITEFSQPDTDDSAEITADDKFESTQNVTDVFYDLIDDPIIPLAYYDVDVEQLICYHWNIETGEVTNTQQVLMYAGSPDFKFRWDGGSYIAVNDFNQQCKGGPGIHFVDNDYLNPVYQDFIIENFFDRATDSFIRSVSHEPVVISNNEQQYQFDFTNINIPGGHEEAYIITGFYFENETAYFLLYPLLDNGVEKNLATINYDVRNNAYKVNMVVNNPEFLGAEAPVGMYVSSSGNKFLVCNFLDGLYEIDGDTYTAQKLFDNHDFALKDNLDYYRIYINSASYYNGYLLLTVIHNLTSEEVDSTTYVVLKDRTVVATMNTKEEFYIPNL